MTLTIPTPRPNRIQDASRLESWLDDIYPSLLDEFKNPIGFAELEMWDWLDEEHGAVLTEFEVEYRAGRA